MLYVRRNWFGGSEIFDGGGSDEWDSNVILFSRESNDKMTHREDVSRDSKLHKFKTSTQQDVRI